jgi:hypothetical protein
MISTIRKKLIEVSINLIVGEFGSATRATGLAIGAAP